MSDSDQSPVESKASFARRLGVHRSAITRGVKSGRVLINMDGKVLINESLKQWEATAGSRPDLKKRHSEARKAKKTGSGINQAEKYVTEHTASSHEDSEEIAEFKRREQKAKNDTRLLQMGIESGDMIEKRDHLKQSGQLGAKLRQSLENLADNLAPQMLNLSPDQAQPRVKQAIEQMLEQTL